MDIKKEIFKYAKENYDSVPEYLWKNDPYSAVLRNNKNSKWYGIVMKVPKEKLGIKKSENIDILNVKCDPLMIGSLIDGKRYFKAYHMNKEHWITLILNGEIPKEEIFSMLSLSYEIVDMKSKKRK